MEDREEMRALKAAQTCEDLGTEQVEIRGRAFLFETTRYTLSDGTVVTKSVGDPIE